MSGSGDVAHLHFKRDMVHLFRISTASYFFLLQPCYCILFGFHCIILAYNRRGVVGDDSFGGAQWASSVRPWVHCPATQRMKSLSKRIRLIEHHITAHERVNPCHRDHSLSEFKPAVIYKKSLTAIENQGEKNPPQTSP